MHCPWKKMPTKVCVLQLKSFNVLSPQYLIRFDLLHIYVFNSIFVNCKHHAVICFYKHIEEIYCYSNSIRSWLWNGIWKDERCRVTYRAPGTSSLDARKNEEIKTFLLLSIEWEKASPLGVAHDWFSGTSIIIPGAQCDAALLAHTQRPAVQQPFWSLLRYILSSRSGRLK